MKNILFTNNQKPLKPVHLIRNRISAKNMYTLYIYTGIFL